MSALPTPGLERPKLLRPILLLTGLLALVYADPLFVRRNFPGRDLLAYNIPMEKSVHDAWAAGRWPVWTPEIWAAVR